MAGQDNAHRDIEESYIERVGGVRETPCSCQRRRTRRILRNLTGTLSEPQPYGDIQVNRNGLI